MVNYRVEDLHAVMESYGDTERQVAILEMGYYFFEDIKEYD